MAGTTTTPQQPPEDAQSVQEAPEAAKTAQATRQPQGSVRIREKRARTATVVTFALTALLCFMACYILITGTEDKNGVIAGAMVVATGAIQFYFGTKNGGTNV